MHTLIPAVFGAALLAATPFAWGAKPAPAPTSYPKVHIETTLGAFTVQLDRPRAPLSVANFLNYVQDNFYNGTIFHRVIKGFVIQGGGYTTDYKKKSTGKPIPNESGNGLTNSRGTIAMARQADPHSATSQFYINLSDNDSLDPQPSRWGYAVFGNVVDGMDVVEKIAAVSTGPAGPLDSDVPQAPVIIKKMELVTPGA